jgi:HEAT repeat protein
VVLSIAFSPDPAAGPARPVRPADERLDEAVARFLQASQTEAADRPEALAALVALKDEGACASIVGEYVRTAELLGTSRARERELTPTVERRLFLLQELEKRAQREPSLRQLVERDEQVLEELQKELGKLSQRIGEYEPWRAILSSGLAELHAALPPEKRQKAERELFQEVERHDDPAVRLGALELLGALGPPGTAAELAKLVADWSVAIRKDQARLPKLMADVHKMEQRLQAEAEATDGRTSRANEDQYRSIKAEAATVRTAIWQAGRQVDAAVAAGAQALAREDGSELEKSMASIVRSLKKAKGRERLDLLALLARADSPVVRARLRADLATESEPLFRGELIDGLAVQGDLEIVPELLSSSISDESWYVRSRAIAALARLRVRAAIPALIERLETEKEGRVRTDAGQALVSLTGQDFRGNVTLWRRWWQENEASFVVPATAPVLTQLETEREAAGMTFFGIRTESQRVLFVLDVSGSMEFSMTPRTNPTDDPGRPHDFPGANEVSRLVAAKRDLIKALGGLRDGGLFNLVLFASDVWTWDDDLVELEPEVRQGVLAYIDEVEAVGGTNIYGALERAFAIATGGRGDGGEWARPAIDTMYLLSDGRASVGLTTDSEQILAFVREQNRSAGIVLHAIGLSGAHDPYLMRSLAEQNGGIYVAR